MFTHFLYLVFLFSFIDAEICDAQGFVLLFQNNVLIFSSSQNNSF